MSFRAILIYAAILAAAGAALADAAGEAAAKRDARAAAILADI